MRDDRREAEYYKRFRETVGKRIANLEEALAANEVVEQNIELVKKVVSGSKFDLLVAGYSDGTNVEELRKGFTAFIQTISDNWFYAWYSETMWILSWGILLEIDNEVMSDFLREVESQYKDDWLMSFLLSYKVEGFTNTAVNVKFSKPYRTLKDIVEKEAHKEEKLVKYLQKKWYKENKDADWYDSHKSEEYTYSGYWSFETAAIVKILNLDAEELKDVEYYPADLHC